MRCGASSTSTACSPTAGSTSANTARRVKAFNTLDGHGLKLLPQGGITPLVITGRDSPAVRRRVADLGLAHAVYGAQDKLAAAQALLAALGVDWDARRRHRRRLARPAAAAARRLRLRPRQRPRRGAGRGRTTSPRAPAAMARRASSATCC